MLDNLIGELVKDDAGMRDFQAERLTLDVTERICQLMDEQGISRADLAALLGVTRSRITNLLSGQANMTLRTMSDAFHAIGRAVHVHDCILSRSLEEPQGSFRLTVTCAPRAVARNLKWNENDPHDPKTTPTAA